MNGGMIPQRSKRAEILQQSGGVLKRAGIPVLANAAMRPPHGDSVWLLGTDSALALGMRTAGADDLAAAMGPVRNEAPAILLAHGPDIFPQVRTGSP